MPSKAAKQPLPKAALAKPSPAKPTLSKAGAKPIPLKPAPAAPDDVPVTGLDLASAKLSPAMAAYFRSLQDRLGFVPNVLAAYAFDMAKLETFVAMYNDLMLGNSGLSKLRARNDRGGGVVPKPLLLLPDRAWRGSSGNIPASSRSRFCRS